MLKYIIRTKDTVKPRRKFEIGLINFIHSTVSQSETIIIDFQPNDLDADELYEFLLQFEGGLQGVIFHKYHFNNIIRLIAAELERLYLFHSQLTINEIEYGEVIEWAKRLHELHYEMEENLNGSQ